MIARLAITAAAAASFAAAQLPTPPCSQVSGAAPSAQVRQWWRRPTRQCLTHTSRPPACPLSPLCLPPARAQYDPTHKLETPCNVELKNTTRYQLRVYGLGGQSWSTATVRADNFSSATSAGFYANFAYLPGENVPKVKIPMTAPVATRTHDEKNWLVSFFTPTSLYPSLSSVPQPTNPDVRIEDFPLATFAVVEFGGEAFEADYKIANALLKAALVEDGVTLAPVTDDWAEVWCGYDAPNDIFNRHNEAWIRVVLCACLFSRTRARARRARARRGLLVCQLPVPINLYRLPLRSSLSSPLLRAETSGALTTATPVAAQVSSSCACEFDDDSLSPFITSLSLSLSLSFSCLPTHTFHSPSLLSRCAPFKDELPKAHACARARARRQCARHHESQPRLALTRRRPAARWRRCLLLRRPQG